jgi:hypothetical protein
MPMNPRLLRPTEGGFRSPDADARAYLAAVRQADGANLEPRVAKAISDFIIGLKADSLWSAIKASCILAGARTLTGALTPLVGSAPTNNGPFVSGDYTRGGATPGLVGNGSTKWLNANRNENADGQNDNHYAFWATTVGTGVFTGNANVLSTSVSNAATRNRNTSADAFTATAGFIGISRSASADYVRRNGGSDTTVTRTSSSVGANAMGILALGSGASGHATHRIAFYSIGSALNLSQLDSRLSALITAIGNAIP